MSADMEHDSTHSERKVKDVSLHFTSVLINSLLCKLLIFMVRNCTMGVECVRQVEPDSIQSSSVGQIVWEVFVCANVSIYN